MSPSTARNIQRSPVFKKQNNIIIATIIVIIVIDINPLLVIYTKIKENVKILVYSSDALSLYLSISGKFTHCVFDWTKAGCSLVWP